MNKKLKSLILSGVLVGSMVSAPTFATENEEQEPTLITEVAEVFKEEPLSKEEVHSDNQPYDDEIDDSETTQPDEIVAPDAIEPVEKVELEKETLDEPIEDEEPEDDITKVVLPSNDIGGITPFSTDVPQGESGKHKDDRFDDNQPLKVDGEEIKNAYTGSYWVNNKYHGKTDNGIIQRQYVDHIDIRIDNATVKINYSENGISKVKNATVTNVSDILINGERFEYVYAGNKREDGVEHKDEFNFQIVDHTENKTPGFNENFDYENYWLDLYKVNDITIMATLTVHEDDVTYTHYNVPIVIEGLKKIVETSVCSNASGLDYHLKGDISDIVEEIPPSFTPDEIDINLTPGTGDISVYGDLYYPVFALAILVAINKKNNKN